MKAKRLIHPEDKVELIKNAKRPIFILGAIVWIALFAFIFGTSFFKFKTGHAISIGNTWGISNSVILILLLFSLSILLYLVWKYLIKKKG